VDEFSDLITQPEQLQDLKNRKGSGAHDFMMEAQSNYNIAIKRFSIVRPGVRISNCRNSEKSR
jgi:hypothetical protein